MKKKFEPVKIENRRARFEYDLLETFTAGLSLEGWEVKSLRSGHANLKAAWITIRRGEAWLENCSISPWRFSQEVQPAERSRKLLLQKKELAKIERMLNEKSHTIVPLKIYDVRGKLKCDLAVVRGRKKYEKRQVLKNRATERTARQAMKHFN